MRNLPLFKVCILGLICSLCLTGCSIPRQEDYDLVHTDTSVFVESVSEMEQTDIVLSEPAETAPPEPQRYPINHLQRYCGVYVENPYDSLKFGDSINTMAWFDDFYHPSDAKIEWCLDEHKATAFITLQPYGWVVRDVISGMHDDLIISYFQKLSDGDRVNTELFVRFAHEFEMRPSYGNGNWYRWQSYDSEAYVQMWIHVVTLGRQYAPNVKWVWSPNRSDEHTIAYYPGDEYVDYVSLTLNNSKDSRESFLNFYETEGKREYLEAYHRPIIFSEVAEHSDSEEFRFNYMSSMFDFLDDYDLCMGVMFLDKDIKTERQYEFSDDEALLQLFIKRAGGYINEKTCYKISDIYACWNDTCAFGFYWSRFLFRSILMNGFAN